MFRGACETDARHTTIDLVRLVKRFLHSVNPWHAYLSLRITRIFYVSSDDDRKLHYINAVTAVISV